MQYKVYSSESMIAVIRKYGIIPLFRGAIPGYSIEEMTDPGCWFTTSDQLGPWDWKIDAVQEGDIAYGKFMGGKAAFATVEFYAHLMNYRRSLPKYRMALGECFSCKTRSEELMKQLSPVALELIRSNGSVESREIRAALSKAVSSVVKKNTSDVVIQFLEMGTWIVAGDIRRVYRGPNLEYNGWQRCSLTTPDELFSHAASVSEGPSWAKRFMEEEEQSCRVECSPEKSREYLVAHLLDMFPENKSEIEKII